MGDRGDLNFGPTTDQLALTQDRLGSPHPLLCPSGTLTFGQAFAKPGAWGGTREHGLSLACAIPEEKALLGVREANPFGDGGFLVSSFMPLIPHLATSGFGTLLWVCSAEVPSPHPGQRVSWENLKWA